MSSKPLSSVWTGLVSASSVVSILLFVLPFYPSLSVKLVIAAMVGVAVPIGVRLLQRAVRSLPYDVGRWYRVFVACFALLFLPAATLLPPDAVLQAYGGVASTAVAAVLTVLLVATDRDRKIEDAIRTR